MNDPVAYWTKEQPNQPGWWWWRYEGCEEPLVLAVRQSENGVLEVQHPFGWLTMELISQRWDGVQWAGPILPPEESL